MHQWVVHLWPRMGRRPVSALPGEVQVSGQLVHEHDGPTQPPVISLCANQSALVYWDLLFLFQSVSLEITQESKPARLLLSGDGRQHLNVTVSLFIFCSCFIRICVGRTPSPSCCEVTVANSAPPCCPTLSVFAIIYCKLNPKNEGGGGRTVM